MVTGGSRASFRRRSEAFQSSSKEDKAEVVSPKVAGHDNSRSNEHLQLRPACPAVASGEGRQKIPPHRSGAAVQLYHRPIGTRQLSHSHELRKDTEADILIDVPVGTSNPSSATHHKEQCLYVPYLTSIVKRAPRNSSRMGTYARGPWWNNSRMSFPPRIGVRGQLQRESTP